MGINNPISSAQKFTDLAKNHDLGIFISCLFFSPKTLQSILARLFVQQFKIHENFIMSFSYIGCWSSPWSTVQPDFMILLLSLPQWIMLIINLQLHPMLWMTCLSLEHVWYDICINACNVGWNIDYLLKTWCVGPWEYWPCTAVHPRGSAKDVIFKEVCTHCTLDRNISFDLMHYIPHNGESACKTHCLFANGYVFST